MEYPRLYMGLYGLHMDYKPRIRFAGCTSKHRPPDPHLATGSDTSLFNGHAAATGATECGDWRTVSDLLVESLTADEQDGFTNIRIYIYTYYIYTHNVYIYMYVCKQIKSN